HARERLAGGLGPVGPVAYARCPLRLARRRARGRRGFPPGPVPGVLDRRDLDPQPLTRSTRAPAGSPDGGVRVFEVFAPYGPESHASRFAPLTGTTHPHYPPLSPYCR